MESTEGTKACPYCAETIRAAAIKCRFCGSSLEPSASEPASPAVRRSTAKPPASILPAVGAAFTILVAVWGAAQATFAWIAFDAGFTGAIIPIWNCAFDLALVAITVGVLRRQRWARDWTIGISALNGVDNAYAALSHNAPIFWVGVIVQAGAAIVLLSAKADLWIDVTPVAARISQALSVLTLAGSFVVPFIAGVGSKQGREAFAAEVQRSYAGIPGVKVTAQGSIMRIESSDDNLDSLKAAAESLKQQLKVAGANAKAWLVGFTAIEMASGGGVIRIDKESSTFSPGVSGSSTHQARSAEQPPADDKSLVVALVTRELDAQQRGDTCQDCWVSDHAKRPSDHAVFKHLMGYEITQTLTCKQGDAAVPGFMGARIKANSQNGFGAVSWSRYEAIAIREQDRWRLAYFGEETHLDMCMMAEATGLLARAATETAGTQKTAEAAPTLNRVDTEARTKRGSRAGEVALGEPDSAVDPTFEGSTQLSQVRDIEKDLDAMAILFAPAAQSSSSVRARARAANDRGYRLLNDEHDASRALTFFTVASATDPTYGMSRYNAAKCFASNGDIGGVLRYLGELKEMGVGQRKRLLSAKTDPAFASVSSNPRFLDLFE